MKMSDIFKNDFIILLCTQYKIDLFFFGNISYLMVSIDSINFVNPNDSVLIPVIFKSYNFQKDNQEQQANSACKVLIKIKYLFQTNSTRN